MDAGFIPHWYIWIGTAAVAGVRWLIYKWREGNAQSWPVTQGTVEWTWTRAEGLQEDRLVPEVCYSYSVNGEFFSGTYETREKNFDLFPKGSRILIHYKPGDPSVSYIDREEVRGRTEARGAAETL
jgi:hypothetical protein